MPAQIPCLWFDGQAEQAAQLYTSLFPRSQVTSVNRAPADTPAGPAGSVLTVEFSLDGQPYAALNGGPEFPFTWAVSFQILCADQEEVDHYWYGLGEGGQPSNCGWVQDRFGLWWQVIPTALPALLRDPDPGRAARAMIAMLGMSRLVIADLEAAADGRGEDAAVGD